MQRYVIRMTCRWRNKAYFSKCFNFKRTLHAHIFNTFKKVYLDGHFDGKISFRNNKHKTDKKNSIEFHLFGK